MHGEFNFSFRLRSWLIALLLPVCTVGSRAQVTTVYLDNYQPVRGELLSVVKGQYLRLALFTGDTIQFAWKDVHHYRTRRFAKLRHFYDSAMPGYRRRGSGYLEASLGLTLFRYFYGPNNYDVELYPIAAIGAGFRFQDRQSVGFYLSGGLDEGEEIAVYLDYRYRPGQRPSGLVLQSRIGVATQYVYYQPATQSFALYPSVGYQHRGPFRTDWLVDIGLRVRGKSSLGYDWQSGTSFDNKTTARLTFRYALRF